MRCNPNYIPRTLIGVGGVRLFDIPGVIYPPEMLKPKKGLTKNGLMHDRVPEWGISTMEAARLLGITRASARNLLNKRHVNFHLVAKAGRKKYWNKVQVEAIAKSYYTFINEQDDMGYIRANEAVMLLGVSRTRLQRLIRKRVLSAVKMRCYDNKTTNKTSIRVRLFFKRNEVEALAMKLSSIRKLEQKINAISLL